jgi:hypothetical protein
MRRAIKENTNSLVGLTGPGILIGLLFHKTDKGSAWENLE